MTTVFVAFSKDCGLVKYRKQCLFVPYILPFNIGPEAGQGVGQSFVKLKKFKNLLLFSVFWKLSGLICI